MPVPDWLGLCIGCNIPGKYVEALTEQFCSRLQRSFREMHAALAVHDICIQERICRLIAEVMGMGILYLGDARRCLGCERKAHRCAKRMLSRPMRDAHKVACPRWVNRNVWNVAIDMGIPF